MDTKDSQRALWQNLIWFPFVVKMLLGHPHVMINVICICYQTKTASVFGDNNIGFIIRSKIRSAPYPMKGLQYGDISQKVGYWVIRLGLSEWLVWYVVIFGKVFTD